MKRPIPPVQVRHLGRQDYLPVWARMRDFTDGRDAKTADELWLIEHPAVYTLGQAGRVEHVRDAGSTPVIMSDRGGQVTYHGPGQVIVYTLLDLRRLGIGIRELVWRLEDATIALLASQGFFGERMKGAPGVYVAGAKVAALGLRVRRGCTYHGIAFNVDPDLSAFQGIDPCGYRDLAVTSLAKLGGDDDPSAVGERLVGCIIETLAVDAAPVMRAAGRAVGS